MESFPIPVIDVAGGGEIGIELDSVFYEVQISRENALQFEFQRLTKWNFEVYRIEEYTKDFYHAGMHLEEIQERIARSNETMIGIQFTFSHDQLEQQLNEALDFVKFNWYN